MTVKEAATHLGVSQTTIRNRVERGTLKKRGILVTMPDEENGAVEHHPTSESGHPNPYAPSPSPRNMTSADLLAAARVVQRALVAAGLGLVTIHPDRITVQDAEAL